MLFALWLLILGPDIPSKTDGYQVARGVECYFALLLEGMLYLRNRYEVEGG